MTNDLERARREAAELLGLDPDKLAPGDRLRCELISALRAAVDDELAKVTSSRSADLGKLIIAVDTLTRFLAEAKPKPEVARSVFHRDPHKVLEDIVDRWIAADEAERAEKEAERRAQGLPANELEAAQMRIAEPEVENARLRGERPRELTESEVVPPSEQGEFYHGGPRPGPDDPKPPVTIDAEPEGSWTGPQNGGPSSWLRPVPKTEKRVDGGPPLTKSGTETKAQMARVNADKSVEHRVMGNARMAQPDNIPGGFFWGGSKGRAW